MKLYTIIIYSLCIFFSLMSCPSTSYQAYEQGDKVRELAVQVMPRKLKVNQEAMVKDSGKVAFEPLFNKRDVASPAGNIETREIRATKGNQEEFNEAKDVDEYFTMDYRTFKKRRPPIHNK